MILDVEAGREEDGTSWLDAGLAGGLVARPGLFGRLSEAPRVTVVSALPGSGKTVLLRSWIAEEGLAGRAAWVAAGSDDGEPQRFWPAVVTALRETVPGSGLVRELTAAPDLDGWAVVERLLTDLASLRERIWLIIDDVHELGSGVLRQLELLLLRAPSELRFVLASRHDLRLGLHRLRLEGELLEFRGSDLRFSLAEAGELFGAAGLDLAEPTLISLVERTEGWAAGLRLAALALADGADSDRFAAEFSGTERTVAEYLLAEVLDRQSDAVRRLLLRTSIMDRVNGELADLLTGDAGGERALQDLERANAFVVSLDGSRSWFRYHQMFAGLLRLELRRSASAEIAGLHRAASGWFAGHGYPVEAIRHAQAAGEWQLAARLLADRWPSLYLDGQAVIVHELRAGFPAQAITTDAELAAVAAGDELAQGSLEAAERYLGLAERGLASVPDTRQRQARLLLAIIRLLAARQRGNVAGEAEEARRLRAFVETPEAAQSALSEELRALALISMGYTQGWGARLDQAEHLEAIALARRIGRPYLEFTGLAYRAAVLSSWSLPGAAECAEQAIELADRHGWTNDPAAGVAYAVLGAVLGRQGRLEAAEAWLQHADRTTRLGTEAEAVAALGVQYMRGQIELVRGRADDALTSFRAAERLAGHPAAPHPLATPVRALLLQTLARLGDMDQADRFLTGLDERERDRGELRIATAVLRLAQGDPRAAVSALAPVLDGSADVGWRTWLAEAFLLAAIAQDELGDSGAAERSLERALDRAEPDGVLFWFRLHPAPDLLERHARQPNSHAALIAEIQTLLAGHQSAPPSASPRPLIEPLSDSELRVLRYLPTNLTVPEIAGELYVSVNTVKTHVRNLYAKIGAHRRADAVARARGLGLLAPSARER